MSFQLEIGNIYRLKVPFEDLYTSVFLIKNEGGNVLIDCATTDEDVNEHIIPALNKEGLKITDIKYLVITHEHIDHSGGKERIFSLNPKIKIISISNRELPSGLSVYEMKGHSLDHVGVYDEKSKTLISGDGLQGTGVSRYPCNCDSKQEYFKTIEKIKLDKKVLNLLFSHSYEPWFKNGVFGREEVEKILNDCIKYAK